MDFQRKYTKIFHKYLKETHGSFAIMFAIMALTLAVGIGAAIDISRLTSARLKLQDLSDSNALALIQDAGITQASGQADFTELLTAQLAGNTQYSNLDVDFNLEKDSAKTVINVTTKAQVNLIFSGLWGERRELRVDSTVELGTQNLEVTLVLDISSSMNDARLTEMQSAAKALIDTLLDENSLQENVSISLVPYGGTVRLPDHLDNMLDGTPPTEHWEGGVWNNCVFIEPSDYAGGIRPNERFGYMPDFYGWNVDQPWCPVDGNEIVVQTNDKDRLFDTIDSFHRSDGTGTDIGVAWGFATLDVNWRGRFEGALPGTPRIFSPRTRKIMILMSDGGITFQRFPNTAELSQTRPYKATNVLTPETEAQAGFEGICNHARNKLVEIYTIGFLISNVSHETKLKQCASDEAKHFSADNGELVGVFNNIALAISPVRIAQ